MKISISDSNNPAEPQKTSALRDQWFERDKLVEEFKQLIDPSQEFIERAKILAAIRLGVMIDEEEALPAHPVILEDTQAMQKLDQILAEYHSSHSKSKSSPPQENPG